MNAAAERGARTHFPLELAPVSDLGVAALDKFSVTVGADDQGRLGQARIGHGKTDLPSPYLAFNSSRSPKSRARLGQAATQAGAWPARTRSTQKWHLETAWAAAS